MLNGAFQMLETGIVPGNRNLDNVEERLKEFQHITYPSRTIRTDGIKSVMLKSFGFGQAGAEILVIHPDYLFAAIETCAYQEYAKRRESRQVHTYRHYHEMLTNTAPLVRVKTAAPYTDAQQSKVYLTPTVRASLKDGKYAYDDASFITQPSATETANISVALQNSFAPLHSEPGVKGVGVDVQLTSVLSLENDVFISRNFTETEIRYCRAAPDPSASFAGRWAAKEAVVKAVEMRPMKLFGLAARVHPLLISKSNEATVKLQTSCCAVTLKWLLQRLVWNWSKSRLAIANHMQLPRQWQSDNLNKQFICRLL
jgi:fatty acid synthase subunit alpha, fungi type